MWELVLSPHYSILGWPRWGHAQAYRTLKEETVAHSCPFLCSAQLSALQAQLMFTGLNWVGFAKPTVLTGEEKLEF